MFLFFCSDEFLAPLARFENKVLYAKLEQDDPVRGGATLSCSESCHGFSVQPYDHLLLLYHRVPKLSPYGLVYGIVSGLKGLACCASPSHAR